VVVPDDSNGSDSVTEPVVVSGHDEEQNNRDKPPATGSESKVFYHKELAPSTFQAH